MSAPSGIEKEVGTQVVNYLARTPQAVAYLFCSFMSGQLWAFIILASYKKSIRGDKYLQTIAGRTALGFAWFVVVLVPLYFWRYQTLNCHYTKLVNLVVPTVVLGLFLQVVIFGLFVRFGKR